MGILLGVMVLGILVGEPVIREWRWKNELKRAVTEARSEHAAAS
jgi:hypothetical protein